VPCVRLAAMDTLLPPRLDPASLYSSQAQRDACRVRVYNALLRQVYARVRAVSRVAGAARELHYVVPSWVPGVPRFDVQDCGAYLLWNLRNADYVAEFAPPNALYVSWGHHDDMYRTQLSPMAVVLRRAAADAAAAAPAKRATAAATAIASWLPPPPLPQAPPPTSFTAPLARAAQAAAPPMPQYAAARPAPAAPAAPPKPKPRSYLRRTDEYNPPVGLFRPHLL
jgi:hypothetical protein